MSETCPTVRIAADNEQGFAVINESDFDQAVHSLYAGAKVKKVAKPANQTEETL